MKDAKCAGAVTIIPMEDGKAQASITCPLRNSIIGKDNNPRKVLGVRSSGK